MILDLKDLEQLPVCLRLEDEAAGLELDVEGANPLGRVRLQLDVMPGDGIYFCRGRSTCEFDLECSRCLDHYRVTLEGEVEFSFREEADESGVASGEALDGELLLAPHADKIDITGPVRESLILAIPMKPLCREECRGLCPVCGVNRNRQECDCVVKEPDSRWEGLRDLLK